MTTKTCSFCDIDTPDGEIIVGRGAQLCLACLVRAFEHTVGASADRAVQIPEADVVCRWCEKPAPHRHSFFPKGPAEVAICTACVSRSYWVRVRGSELSDHRREYWSEPGKGATHELIEKHFRQCGYAADSLVTTARTFATRLRVDLQRCLGELLEPITENCVGFRQRWEHETIDFAALLSRDGERVRIGPLTWEEIDVGEDEPARCVRRALWVGESESVPYGVLIAPKLEFGCNAGLHVEVATPSDEQGLAFAEGLFRQLEKRIELAPTYRGKILSLERNERDRGVGGDVTVHRLDPLERDQVILPERTLELLERNVFAFVNSRPALRKVGMPLKKGLLFYGPPGTGKTHTIRFLMSALPDHTTLLVTAEQVAHIAEYVSLARLLAPSILVIEDVDLIARHREDLGTPMQESLLNRLLNEMDGLREDAELLFILTTNHAESLEAALASRPGRVDQAIEFPLPDASSRSKLIRLYARGLQFDETLLEATAARTEGVSAAFIKELMRRAAQAASERGTPSLQAMAEDIDLALDEMLFRGGRLNAKLLGASAAKDPCTAEAS